MEKNLTLERILSLIPKDESGKVKYGAQSEFARAIGYKDGHVISMWRNGASDTYKSKLADIALKTGVSVEWLKGETDDPRPGYVMTDYGSMPDVQLIARAGEKMTPEQRQSLIRYIRYMFPEAFDDQEQGK